MCIFTQNISKKGNYIMKKTFFTLLMFLSVLTASAQLKTIDLKVGVRNTFGIVTFLIIRNMVNLRKLTGYNEKEHIST